MVSDIMMERMTSPRVKEAVAAGADTALIMLGATEQHGPHLPLASDALIAEWVGTRIAARLGQTLMAPVIRPGCSDHHMAFSGTISLRSETLKAILHDYCASLVEHGFKKIIIITIHGGNMKPMIEVAPELARTFDGVEIHVMTEAEPMLASVWAVSKKHGVDPLAAGAHAGEAESSMLLAGAPELTEMDRAERGLVAEMSEWSEKAHAEGLQSVTPNGVLGDPAGSNAGAGLDYLDALAMHHVNQYRQGRMLIKP